MEPLLLLGAPTNQARDAARVAGRFGGSGSRSISESLFQEYSGVTSRTVRTVKPWMRALKESQMRSQRW